jgi:hypothetical protein
MRLLVTCEQPAHNYRWKEHQHSWYLIKGDRQIGELLPFKIRNLQTRDEIEEIGNGVFRITRTCRNTGKTTADSVRITLDFIHLSPTDFNMIPSVSYNGNNWGRGKEPKGFEQEGQSWTFSSRRTSVPGATYSEGEDYALALWGEFIEKQAPFSCSLMPGEDQTVHRLIWPEEEGPLSYTRRDQYSEGSREHLAIPPGESIKLQAYLVVEEVKPNHKSIAGFLTAAWEHSQKKFRPVKSPDEIWDYAIAYVKNDLWAEEGNFRGFSIGLIWQDGEWIQRPEWKYEIGWCGQNASISNSLLWNFLKTGDLESKEKAVLCLDTWAEHCPLPNGLFRTHFDYILGITQGKEILDACNLGTAALNYFEAFELAGKCGLKRPQYRDIAFNICEFMVRDQGKNGCYGKGWTTAGECLYREGTIGAFLITPILKAYEMTGKETLFQSAKLAFDYYYGGLETHGFTTAGALDTWCIDKESSMPLLRSALLLHELTNEDQYLEAAEHISWYLSTWLWHYSGLYPAESDFSRYGYHTFGATAVSTQHHHLDPYALSWVKDWLDLSERTGNITWKEKAQAIWYNGNQLISDGTLLVKGKTRPAGSQNEAFYQANWNGDPGTINDWLVAWPGAFRLETLRRLDNWDVLSQPLPADGW